MAFNLLKTPWIDKMPQPPEALFGSGGMHVIDTLNALFPHDCAAADADGDRTVRVFGEPGIDL